MVFSLTSSANSFHKLLEFAILAAQKVTSDPMEKALTFTTLIVANLGLILTNRSWSRTILNTLRSPNKALWWVLGGTVLFLGLVLYVPFLRTLFHFSRLHLTDLILCLSAGLVSIFWFEGLKAINGRRKDR